MAGCVAGITVSEMMYEIVSVRSFVVIEQVFLEHCVYAAPMFWLVGFVPAVPIRVEIHRVRITCNELF